MQFLRGKARMKPKYQRQQNSERILAIIEKIMEIETKIMERETAEMPVVKAIIVASRFAETCSSLRKKSDEEPNDP